MAHEKNFKQRRKQRNDRRGSAVILGLGTLVLIALIGFLVLGNRPASYTPEFHGGPRLQTDQQKVELGDQKLGTTVELTLNIKNVGDQPLVFTKAPYIEVKEGCCPSTPSIGKLKLRPGETTTITFPMMMHPGMGGYHDFRVHVPNNDSENSDFEFTVLSNWVD